MMIHKRLLVILILTSFLSNLVVLQSSAINSFSVQNKSIYENVFDQGGYIIKFRGEPLSVFIYKLENKIKNVLSYLTGDDNDLIAQKIDEYKNILSSLHRNAKSDILELLGSSYNSEEIISDDFINLFNGIAVKNIPGSILNRIKTLSYVDDVFPDYTIRACLSESIPLINADDVWKLKDSYGRNVTGEGVSIAIFDSGVDYNHPALGGGFGYGYKVVGGYDFVNDDSDPMDDNGHGTHCAGIALGVAPGASLYAYKVLNYNGEGNVSGAIKAMEKVVDPNSDGDFSDHLNIISMSFGSATSGDPDDVISMAADNAVSCGVVLVAAAGNSGKFGYGTISSPACARKVISVGYSTKDDKVSPLSSRGPSKIGMVKPDVVAPGVNINSTWLGGGYEYKSGTSMACPHVAGTVALILQMHPEWNPDEVKMSLRNTAVDLGYDINTQGFGRIDALKAVTLQDAPPIAILNTSGNFNQGIIDIYGTAKGKDFQNYSLYYKNFDEWIKIYENENEVSNDFLFTWDTSSLNSGSYQLKLQVNSLNQTSTDIVFITFNWTNNQTLFIDAPVNINELTSFTVNITDKYTNPVKVLVFFIVPNHIPRVKYGSSVAFKAPRIINPFTKNLEGKIIVIKLIGREKINKTITLVNERFSFFEK